VNKNLSVLFSLVLVLLLGSSFISKTHAQTATVPNKVVLNQAADRFYTGWATGDWEPFIATLSDDFIFQFPAGPYAGRHVGAGAKNKLVAWAREHGKAGNRVPNVEITLRVHDKDWIVLNDRGSGVIDGKPYDNLHAIEMKAKNGKIVEFREYFGNLTGFK
jgi:ketosteroid isomerase-like protein